MPHPFVSAPCWVVAFYHFAPLDQLSARQASLRESAQALGLKGSLLLAAEGVNGTLAGSDAGLAAFLQQLRALPGFEGLEAKYSQAPAPPFERLKVRLKKEIVSLGQPEADPTRQVGQYVEPEDWNALIQEPDVLLIDTRNAYETAIGRFAGAEDPQTESFRDFPAYVQGQLDPSQHKRVAMYCTGGIRCEKASSWMLQQGFEQVYHLKGGILKYLESVSPEESLWEGACFVFDERVAVDHQLAPSEVSMCWGCGYPVDPAGRAHPDYVEGASCAHCKTLRSPEQQARSLQSWREKQRQRRVTAPQA
ncbi:MAG: rhodanese-related sulfurtransferase [Candidatus Sericytochromatia bacterium]